MNIEENSSQVNTEPDVMSKVDLTTGKQKSTLHKYDRFVEAYLDFTKATYMNGTKSAIAAGYKPSNATYMGCMLLKQEYVQQKMKEWELKRNGDNQITIDWIKDEYVQLYKTCLKDSDRTNAKNCLADLAKMFGAFVDVQRTELYDGRAPEMTEEESEELDNIARQYKIKLSS